MGKKMNQVFGGLHKTSVDPANLLSEKKADPLGVYKLKDKGAVTAAAPAPMEMPDADGEAVAAAKRRKVAALKNRGGRTSTIITGGNDLLGG